MAGGQGGDHHGPDNYVLPPVPLCPLVVCLQHGRWNILHSWHCYLVDNLTRKDVAGSTDDDFSLRLQITLIAF